MVKTVGSPKAERLRRLLRDMRRERGFTQADLAEQLHEQQSFVSKYEIGERQLAFVEVERVCAVLGVSLTAFIRRLER